MKHPRTILAALSATAFFSTVGLAFAFTNITYYKGTRDDLRTFCLEQDGKLSESTHRTRCSQMFGGLEFTCLDTGVCSREELVTLGHSRVVGGVIASTTDSAAMTTRTGSGATQN